MLEKLKETIDKGIEFAFMTTEKLTQSAKELAKDNNLTREEAKKLLDYLVKKSEETRNTVETSMQEMLKSALKKMDIPNQSEIRKLEARVAKLEGFHKKPAAGVRKPARPAKKK
jgi:polyhydroxyalkanoate synthesis regulator phasin